MDKFLILSTSRQEKRRYIYKNINNDCDSCSTMHEKPLPKKQKQQRDFNEKWLTDITFKNWISKREQECGMITAYCKVCDCTVLNHKPALVKHINTSKHIQNISSKSQLTTPIQQMMKPKPEDELKKEQSLTASLPAPRISGVRGEPKVPAPLICGVAPFGFHG